MAQAKKKVSKKAPAKKAAAVTYKLNVGDTAPGFKSEATSGNTVESKSLKGQAYVLYFYPKDNTPGCTLEGHDFQRLLKKFKNINVEVFGVSRDSMKAHENFKEKCGFEFDLLSDADSSLCDAFDVIQMKSLYGKKFQGIERSTFLIDAKGKVRNIWRKVKVNGHADEVLKAASEL